MIKIPIIILCNSYFHSPNNNSHSPGNNNSNHSSNTSATNISNNHSNSSIQNTSNNSNQSSNTLINNSNTTPPNNSNSNKVLVFPHSLATLNLSRNSLEELRQVDNLSYLKNLTSLDIIHSNPFALADNSSNSNYNNSNNNRRSEGEIQYIHSQQYIVYRLPTIEILDGEEITDNMRYSSRSRFERGILIINQYILFLVSYLLNSTRFLLLPT